MAGKTTRQHRIEILGCLRTQRAAFGIVTRARGARWWTAATELSEGGMCRFVPTAAHGGTEWACIPYGTTFDPATREVAKPAPGCMEQLERLPNVGDEVWFVFHGLVCRGRVSRVDKPGQPMAYACVFVKFGDRSDAGVTCLHGRGPTKPNEGDGWYWSERDAWNVVALELEREAELREPQLN